MVFDKLQEYVFLKLIFPKRLLVDFPGLIISKTVSFFGKEVKTRTVFTFEDLYVSLYFDTVKECGRKFTEELWYKIGKDMITRYLLFGNFNKISLSKIPLVLKYFQGVFSAVGMTFFSNLKYDLDKKEFIFEGRDNVVVRKTKGPSFMNGMASGLISFLLKQNLESSNRKVLSNEKYSVIVSPKFKERYLPDFDSLKPSINYPNNFRKDRFNSGKLYSFSELLKFKIITVDDKNKFSFLNRSLIPGEIGLPELFFRAYSFSGKEDLFKKSVSKFYFNIFSELFSNLNNQEKLRLFRNFLSGLGYGNTVFKFEKNCAKVFFSNFPKVKFGNHHLIILISSFLEYFKKKKFNLDSSSNNLFIFK